MAIRLLVVLIALGLLHVAPQLARWRGDGWFRRWIAQLGDTSGGARVAVALLLPAALCVLVVWMLGWSPLGELLRLLFALAVLVVIVLCTVLRFENAGRLGGVTVAIIILIPHTGPIWHVAIERFLEVSFGIGISLAVALTWTRASHWKPFR